MALHKKCEHVMKGGPKIGKPCGRWALDGQPLCYSHSEQALAREKKQMEMEQEDESPKAPAKFTPEESPESAALRGALEEQGLDETLVVEAAVRRQTEAEAKGEEDPFLRPAPKGPLSDEDKALRESLALLAQDRIVAKQQQAARDRARKLGKKLPPLTSRLFVADTPDVIAITDVNGKSLVKPGWIGRWVRLIDSQGRESNVRLREFQGWGAEVILDPDKPKVDGKLQPKRDVWGIAVQMPPDRYGARVIDRSPHGAFDNDQILSNLDDLAESMNSQAGYRAVGVVPADEHGSRS